MGWRIQGALGFVCALAAGVACAATWELDPPAACGTVSLSRFQSDGYALVEQVDGTVIPRVQGGGHERAVGEPHLPFLARRLSIPRGCEAEIEILSVESVETNTPSIKPVNAHVLREEGGVRRLEPVSAERAALYQVDAFWPPEPMEIQYATQGTQCWARVVINPIQYNPVRGILRWNKSIEARLHWRAEPATP